MAWQLCLNSVAAAAAILLVAVGFSLIYSVAKFYHFAHAIVFTAAAYGAYFCVHSLALPIGLSIVLGIGLGTGLGCLLELLVHRHLRKDNASSPVMLLASLGVYIALQNLLSLAFGDDIKLLTHFESREGIPILSGTLAPVQCVTILCGTVLIFALVAFEQLTPMGKVLRALASDSELAEVVGVRKGRAFLVAFAIGSSLAATGGVLLALDVGMTPTMGMNALMAGIVAAVVGGIGRTAGVAAAAVLLGFAQNFGVWKIGSEWQQAITFLILLVFLVLRPQGILGRQHGKAGL
jgi:branched-subunit amino acid ABC-type transport system permease component